jgi:hypothetical protein
MTLKGGKKDLLPTARYNHLTSQCSVGIWEALETQRASCNFEFSKTVTMDRAF